MRRLPRIVTGTAISKAIPANLFIFSFRMFDVMLAGRRRHHPIKTAYSNPTGTLILKFVWTSQNWANELRRIKVNPENIASLMNAFIFCERGGVE